MKKKSLSINTIFYLFYNILNILFPFVTGVYVARVLLADNIGEISYAQNIVQYFIIFSFLGIPTYGMREVSKHRNDKDKLNKLFSELFTINLISTIIFSVIYFLIIFSIPRFRSNYLIHCIFGLTLILNTLNITWLFEGLEDFKHMAVRNLIIKIVSFSLLVFFVRNQSDYLKYAFLFVVGMAGSYFVDIISARKKVKLTFKNLSFKQHMQSILFLVVINLAIEIYTMVDITMLGIIYDNETVAFYSYGSKIFKILLQVVNTFTIVVVPRLSLLKKENDLEGYNYLISKTLTILLMISLPMIIGIFFTSSYLIPAIYGVDYIRSSPVLIVLSLNLLISPIGYLLGSRVMLVNGKEKLMLIPVSCGAIVNVVGNSLLIPYFGEVGAAIASVLGEVIVSIVYLSMSHKYFKVTGITKSVFKIVLSCIVMIVLLYSLKLFISNSLVLTIVQIVSAVITYFLSLLCLKERVLINYTSTFLNRLISKKRVD